MGKRIQDQGPQLNLLYKGDHQLSAHSQPHHHHVVYHIQRKPISSRFFPSMFIVIAGLAHSAFFRLISLGTCVLDNKQNLLFLLAFCVVLPVLTSPSSQHRSLQPTGPPTQGPSQQHSHARLNESFEAIRQEFDGLTSDIGVLRNQRDDYESKGMSHCDSSFSLTNCVIICSIISSERTQYHSPIPL